MKINELDKVALLHQKAYSWQAENTAELVEQELTEDLSYFAENETVK